MANPSYDETYRHILSFMSDGNICTKKMIKDELISHFEMTDSEINEISSVIIIVKGSILTCINYP